MVTTPEGSLNGPWHILYHIGLYKSLSERWQLWFNQVSVPYPSFALAIIHFYTARMSLSNFASAVLLHVPLGELRFPVYFCITENHSMDLHHSATFIECYIPDIPPKVHELVTWSFLILATRMAYCTSIRSVSKISQEWNLDPINKSAAVAGFKAVTTAPSKMQTVVLNTISSLADWYSDFWGT